MKKIFLSAIILLLTNCSSTIQSRLQSDGWIPLGDFQRTGFVEVKSNDVPKESLLGMTCDSIGSLEPDKHKSKKLFEKSWIITNNLPSNMEMKSLDKSLKLKYLKNDTNLNFSETLNKTLKIDPKTLAKILIDNKIIIPVSGVTVDKIISAMPSFESTINYTTTVNKNSTRIIDQKNIINILSNIAGTKKERYTVDSVFIADLDLSVTISNNLSFPKDIIKYVKTGTTKITGNRIILGYRLVSNKNVLNESVKEQKLSINDTLTLQEPSLKFLFDGKKINFITMADAYDLYDKTNHKDADISKGVPLKKNISLFVYNQNTVYHLDFRKKGKSFFFSKNIYTIDRKNVSIDDIEKLIKYLP